MYDYYKYFILYFSLYSTQRGVSLEDSSDSSVWTACALVSRDGRHRDRTCSHSTVHAYHKSILRIAQNQQPRGSHLSHKCRLFSYNGNKYSSITFNILPKNLSLTHLISPYLVSQYVNPTIFSFENFKSRLLFLKKLLCFAVHS